MIMDQDWTWHGHGENAHLATWTEIAPALQLQTGIRLATGTLDMRSQEHAFRTMVRAVWSKAQFMQNGEKLSGKQAWVFKA